MDTLHSVEEASSQDEESWSLTYILENGDRYTEITTGLHFDDRTNVTTIFEIPK